MSDRLKVLSFLQETSVTLRHLAREQGGRLSPEMIRIADEIAHEAANLEAELIEAGLLGRAANES